MDAVRELVSILDREAVVVEGVLFRLKAIELLLTADEHRFLPSAVEDLDTSLESLGALEAVRALTAEEIGEALGLEAGTVTVSDVLKLADERTRGPLLRAQLQLRRAMAELEERSVLAKDLALARIAQVRASLERFHQSPGSRYGQDGIIRGARPPMSFDERL